MIFEQSGALFLPMQWANHIYRDHKAQRNEADSYSWMRKNDQNKNTQDWSILNQIIMHLKNEL